MGFRPTHPELLDWLASEFIARNGRSKDASTDLYFLLQAGIRSAFRLSVSRAGTELSGVFHPAGSGSHPRQYVASHGLLNENAPRFPV